MGARCMGSIDLNYSNCLGFLIFLLFYVYLHNAGFDTQIRRYQDAGHAASIQS